MKKNVLAIFYAFLATVLFTSSALAGGSVKLSGATFYLGSLIAEGTLTGLGNSETTRVVLDASGPADITCTNPGKNAVPGHSSPRLSASGKQDLGGINGLIKNGKSPFNVETDDPITVDWKAGGCPNSSWTAYVDFIYWEQATLSVFDIATNSLLLQQEYICTTTRYPASVSCMPVP
jgi:hypothetical protein